MALGDTITWDVQGVRVATVVTSLREVQWARFEPNFFVVFEPRALRDAPKSFALLTRVDERDGARGAAARGGGALPERARRSTSRRSRRRCGGS